MMKNNIVKWLTASAVVLGVIIGGVSAVPAQAAPAAPSIALKTFENGGEKEFSVTYADIAEGYRLYIMDQDEMTKSYQEHHCTSIQQYFDDEYYYYDDDARVGSDYGSADANDTEASISVGYGTKKVVAYLIDTTGAVSGASNVLTVKGTPDKPYVSTAVKQTSITLTMRNGDATGYQIYRKIGKKYQKLATIASNTYKDSNLTASTDYTYKVRSYYKDPETGKITYSPYQIFKRTTKGGALKMKVQVTGKKNVKLSWTKVKGATAYEVYRSMGASAYSTKSKGQPDSYGAYKLVKTLGAKKKSFTDKKTMAGEGYTYIVRAILGTEKDYVQENKSVDLNFNEPVMTQDYVKASGNRTLVWKKVYGATGYIVEKKQVNGSWAKVKTLGSSKTTYTFVPDNPRLVGTNEYDNDTEYRLYAYKDGGKTISGYYYVTVSKSLGLVQSVSAKRSGDKVTVSWTPVSGASYYQVYRVREDSLVKDNDLGGYEIDPYDYDLVTEYVEIAAPVQDTTSVYTDGKVHYLRNYQYSQTRTTKTSMADYYGDAYGWDGDSEPDNKYSKPEKGVSYQYYVVAYQAVQTGSYTEYVHPVNVADKDAVYQTITVPSWSSYMSTSGCKKLSAAVKVTDIKAAAKPVIKSLKANKKTVTIKLKKKVKNASEYRIYRAEAKKNGKAGKYVCIATTNKTTYKDSGLTGGKKYFYKVKAVRANEAGADILSAFSKVKNVSVK